MCRPCSAVLRSDERHVRRIGSDERPVRHLALPSSSSGLLVEVGGAVDSDGGGSDVVPGGSVGSTLPLGAGVVSTTGAGAGTAVRRVRAGVGRGRCVVVGAAVGVGVSSGVCCTGLVSAGTSGAGRLTGLSTRSGRG